MATAKGGYFLKSGERVPSVTTVIGRFKDAGALMNWSWKEGLAGRDYRETRDKAAEAGNLAHAAAEAWFHKKEYEFIGDPDTVDKAKRSFSAFLEWTEQTKLTVSHAELPLISEKHRFAGTFDCLLVNGKRTMGDYKTSRGLYPDYMIQVAAYGKLWEENFPDQPIDGGFLLLRFDKEYGDFHSHWWGELDRAWEAFLHLRALYDIEKELKQRAK